MKDGIRQIIKTVSQCSLCHGENGILVPTIQVPKDGSNVRVLLLGEQPDRDAILGKKKTARFCCRKLSIEVQ